MGDYNNYYSHDLAFSGEEYNMVCDCMQSYFNHTCYHIVNLAGLSQLIFTGNQPNKTKQG